MLAVVPGVPTSFARIDYNTLVAGTIRVSWSLPASNGGTPILGYKLYVANVLYYDGSATSTVTSYTITDLSVGLTYSISVTAVNAIGESSKTSLSLLAASVPSKMSQPTLSAATSSSITIAYSTPSFNGGDSVTGYAIRRDNGPLTSF
jgi:hypothetical protein